MNPDLLAALILEGQNNIKNIAIIPRDYHFENSLNYVLVGLRRAGKSTLLFKRAQDLVNKQKCGLVTNCLLKF